MANPNLIDALKELTNEKNIPMEVLINAIKEALVVAYKKVSDADEKVEVRLNEETGEFRVFSLSTVIDSDTLENPDCELTLEDAKKLECKQKSYPQVVNKL